MDRTERFYRIHQLLLERQAVPLRLMIEDLGVSRATVIRDLEYLRDRLNAPIVWDRGRRGYRYEQPDGAAPRFSLPGLWFNGGEIHALLTMEHLLSNLQPGLLGPHIAPLRTRIRMLLDSGDRSAEEVTSRIKLLRMAARDVDPETFQATDRGRQSRRARESLLHRQAGVVIRPPTAFLSRRKIDEMEFTGQEIEFAPTVNHARL